jgi:DHA1 family bicyclomycin/chloramphenicol resistance-like MFS transporter
MNRPLPHVPQPDRPKEEGRGVPLWLLTLVTFSGTLAMHIFVPALPRAAHDLGAGIAAMQMTVSLYIGGLAAGQLIYGPLADRFGRRPVLMAGLAVYTAAGLAAALAPGAHALIAARLFQALGGCAGLVLGRAIVRDTALPREAARRLAIMNLMVMVGPGVAPLIGSALAATSGWRSILFLLSGLGIANFVLTWRLLPETRPSTANSNLGMLALNYRRLLSSHRFLGFALGGGCATTSLYAFIAAAPFIFVDELGRPASEVGIYLAVLISGVWLGSLITSRLISRVATEQLLMFANVASVLSAFVFLGLVFFGHLSVVSIMTCMFAFAVGSGIASPTALTLAISVRPEVAGSASGLYGFTQMIVGMLATALAGLGRDPALAVALVLAGAGALGQMSFWIALRTQKPKAQG